MQLRVVTDQPWDVPADVLVVPVAAKPEFDGALGELDRRAGGELQALATFGEVRGKRYAAAIASAGEAKAGRLLSVGLGDPATVDREVAVRVGAAALRRLGGRDGPSPGVLARSRRRRPRRRCRGGGRARHPWRRGRLVRPADDLPRRGRPGPADPRRADPRRSGRRRGHPDPGGRAGPGHRRGLGDGADPVEPRLERRQSRRPGRRGARHRRAARPVDRRHRPGRRRPRWAWACSWRSAAAATTRRG